MQAFTTAALAIAVAATGETTMCDGAKGGSISGATAGMPGWVSRPVPGLQPQFGDGTGGAGLGVLRIAQDSGAGGEPRIVEVPLTGKKAHGDDGSTGAQKKPSGTTSSAPSMLETDAGRAKAQEEGDTAGDTIAKESKVPEQKPKTVDATIADAGKPKAQTERKAITPPDWFKRMTAGMAKRTETQTVAGETNAEEDKGVQGEPIKLPKGTTGDVPTARATEENGGGKPNAAEQTGGVRQASNTGNGDRGAKVWRKATGTLYSGAQETAYPGPDGKTRKAQAGVTAAVDGKNIEHNRWIEVRYADGTIERRFTHDTGADVRSAKASKARGRAYPVLDVYNRDNVADDEGLNKETARRGGKRQIFEWRYADEGGGA